MFEFPGLSVETPQGREFLISSKSSLGDCRFQYAYGFVIHLHRHRKGCRSLPPWASENRAGSENR